MGDHFKLSLELNHLHGEVFWRLNRKIIRSRRSSEIEMGVCGSRPEGCGGGLVFKKTKKKIYRKRRRVIKRRVSSKKFSGKLVSRSATDRSFHDVSWFDSTSALDSELDDEFYSVYDDELSPSGSESPSSLSFSSKKDFDLKESGTESSRNGNAVRFQRRDSKSILKPDDPPNNVGGEGTAELHHCGGRLPSACLPCLAAAGTVALEKKRSFSPGTPSSRRKALSKLSFKWREGHADVTILPPRALQQRPIAGSSIPFCPSEKRMPYCWSPIEPSAFKVRGKNYTRDKKKDSAPNCAAYYPFGADVFISQRKIEHIARFVEFPHVYPAGEIPSMLVVNIQIPLYPATLFQSENDGEGMNLVLYFKLSESFSEDLPPSFRENINRLINDEVERVRGFPVDTIASYRERLKIIGRVANVEDLHLSAAGKKLINAYNEKPVLSRPQHEFYLGENYFEIDIDMHRFSYFARKGFEEFQDRMKLCILDFGLTLQGNKAEDLPEHMLCCIRLNEIDYKNHNQLVFS